MNFPLNQREFEQAFATNNQCREYIFNMRHPEGFVCRRCGHTKHCVTARGKSRCTKCKCDHSILTGTIFEDSRVPLTTWFRAIWMFTVNKNGVSATGLKNILGLGSYWTAWTLLHKIRRAMITTSKDLLHGQVEVDECFIGGPAEGKRGRGAANKVMVAVATEVNGRVRMKVIENAKYATITDFVESNIEKGTEVITDGFGTYKVLPSHGYTHTIEAESSNKLGHVHMTISLAKRWLLGTLQGSVSKVHLQEYLNEFVFRFNRRKSKSRGLLFQRVLENGITLPATQYKDIVAKKAS